MRRLAGDASRKQSQVEGVKEQFLLGRVDESPSMSSRARAQPKQSPSSEGEQQKQCCASKEYWRGQRRAAHGGGPRRISEARASPCPRRDVFSFPGAASEYAAQVSTTENTADIMIKVLSAVRHRELCRPDVDLDAVPEASVMAPRSFVSSRRLATSRYAGSYLLMFVRHSPVAEQTG